MKSGSEKKTIGGGCKHCPPAFFFLHHHVVKRSFYYMGEILVKVLLENCTWVLTKITLKSLSEQQNLHKMNGNSKIFRLRRAKTKKIVFYET